MKYIYSVIVDSGSYEDAPQWQDSLWSYVVDAERRKEELLHKYSTLLKEYDQYQITDEEYDELTKEQRDEFWKKECEFMDAQDINSIQVERIQINTIKTERYILSTTRTKQ